MSKQVNNLLHVVGDDSYAECFNGDVDEVEIIDMDAIVADVDEQLLIDLCSSIDSWEKQVSLLVILFGTHKQTRTLVTVLKHQFHTSSNLYHQLSWRPYAVNPMSTQLKMVATICA